MAPTHTRNSSKPLITAAVLSQSVFPVDYPKNKTHLIILGSYYAQL